MFILFDYNNCTAVCVKRVLRHEVTIQNSARLFDCKYYTPRYNKQLKQWCFYVPNPQGGKHFRYILPQEFTKDWKIPQRIKRTGAP